MKENKIDNLGRIVIPSHLRRELSLTTDTPLQICRIRDSVLITPMNKICALCGDTITHKGIRLCDACINKVKEYKN